MEKETSPMRWYVSENGSASGPFSEERVVTLLKWGKISRKAYVCDERCSQWFSIVLCPFAAMLEGAGDGAEGAEPATPAARFS